GPEHLPRPLQVDPQVEPVPAGGVELVVTPGRDVHHHSLAVGDAQPAPYLPGQRPAAGEDVVTRVPVLADLALVPERAPEDRGAERVLRQQQVPLADVGSQAVEVGGAAGELRAADVEADLLQRGPVPGLQVDLALPLAEV